MLPKIEDDPKVPSSPKLNEIDAKKFNVSLDLAVPDQFPTPVVPKKSKVPGLTIIGTILVVSFTTMGIGALQSIFSDIGSFIIRFLFGSTGLPSYLGNIFIGIVCLCLAVIILYWMGRWKEIVPAIKESTQVLTDKEPSEFYELSQVESKYLFKELKNRGCVISGGSTGTGWNVDCPNIPITKASQELIKGIDEKYNNRQKILQFVALNTIATAFVIFYILGNMDENWGKWLVFGIYVFMIYCQLGMDTIRLFTAVILYWIYTSIIWLFAPFTPISYICIIVAIGIILILLYIVGYIIKPDSCYSDTAWWCKLY